MNSPGLMRLVCWGVLLTGSGGTAVAAQFQPPGFACPFIAQVAGEAASHDGIWTRVLLLRDYNTRVVVVGASLLGAASGLVGSFALLRRRALMGDAISHATLPGICLAWLICYAAGYDGKSLPWLLTGAAVTGVLGALTVVGIRRSTRLPEDAALGIVLSVFFGAGVSLLGLIQKLPAGSAAGLRSFIDGKAASLSTQDVLLIAGALLVTIAVLALFMKEMRLLCFDDGYATSEGFPVLMLEIVLMGMIVMITIVGLQAVGLVLMVALLVIPPAAARFWTHQLHSTLWIAAAIGAVSGASGALASAVWPDLPSGPLIVLVAAALFALSLLFGSARGLVQRVFSEIWLNRKIAREHLLRAMFEASEGEFEVGPTGTLRAGPEHFRKRSWVAIRDLLEVRSWTSGQLRRVIQKLERDGGVESEKDLVCLTGSGWAEAARVAREHRLWELYLIAFAEVTPGRVDRGADAIEHVLDPAVINRLEQMLAGQVEIAGVPSSPHPLAAGNSETGRTRTEQESLEDAVTTDHLAGEANLPIEQRDQSSGLKDPAPGTGASEPKS